MTRRPEHIAGQTVHARRGAIGNRFRYGVDYVLIDPEARGGPALFSRNRRNLASVRDSDHGGRPGQGRGAEWAREVLAAHGFAVPVSQGIAPSGGRELLLLTQPGFLGKVFNPVSFWLAMEDGVLRAVIAEVTTPFGDRHSYLCRRPGFAPIHAHHRIKATKALHVSPFQDVAGEYTFNFRVDPGRIAIRIHYANGAEGVVATLTGDRRPLTSARILRASLRRPLGAMRTLLLIYWQAGILKLKGAAYRKRPRPPAEEVT